MTDSIGTGLPQFSCAFVQIRYAVHEKMAAITFSEDRKESNKREKGVGMCERQSL